MKKLVFYSILVGLVCLVLLLILKIFTSFYDVVLYRKHTRPEFVTFLKGSTISAIDKGFQLPDMRIGDTIDLRRAHPYCGFKTQPGIRINTNPEFYTNGLGHRSPTLGVKRKGVIRIAMLGGSVAFDGNTNDRSMIGMLADRLRKRGYEVEYINASVVSSVSNQELSILVHDLLDLQVDLVISFDGYNDVVHPLYRNGRIGWPPLRWDPLMEMSCAKGFFIDKTGEFSPQKRSYYPPIRPLKDHLTEKEFRAMVDNYLNNINKMATIAQAFKIRYLAVLQPMRGFRRANCQTSCRLSTENMFYCAVEPVFAQWDRQRQKGAAYVSLADCLAAQEDLFVDECHFKEPERPLVVQKLLEIIDARKLLSKSPTDF